MNNAVFQGHFFARKVQAGTGSTRVVSFGFDCPSRAPSREEGCENMGYGLPGSHHWYKLRKVKV